MTIPKLNKSKRRREYDSVSDDIRNSIVYNYLFHSRSHRWLDENVIGLDAEYSHGYVSMGVLHFLGIKKDFKGLFDGVSVNKALKSIKEGGTIYASIYNIINFYINKVDSESEEHHQDISGEYIEGKELLRKHKYRERSHKLI